MPIDPHPQEAIPSTEADVNQRLVRVNLAMLDLSRHPIRRGQHPKQNGCVRARFVVDTAEIPANLRVGLFARSATYEAWIRFSNGRQDDDEKGDAHGMAIKLLGVVGPKALDSAQDEQTHDFILMDHPVFFARNAASILDLLEAQEQSNRPSPLASFLRVVMAFWSTAAQRRQAYVVLRHFIFGRRFRELKTLIATVAKKPTSPLRISYWSVTSYALGERTVKYKAAPVIPSTVPEPTDMSSPDRLRAAMETHLDQEDARFDFLVQLQEPAGQPKMPVEDAAIEWLETQAPFHKVATIVIPRQTFNTPEREKFCENLSFTPWHALLENRPIGGINRARKDVYEALSERRHSLNKVNRVEPKPEGAAGQASTTPQT